MLDADELQELSNCVDPAQIVAVLSSNKGYGPVLSTIPTDALLAEHFEDYIYLCLYNDIGSLYKFASYENKKIMFPILRRYEALLIKKHYRNISQDTYLNNNAIDSYKQLSFHLSPNAKEILSTTTKDSLISSLKKSYLKKAFTHVSNAGDIKNDFEFDSLIDNYINLYFWKNRKKYFSGDELKAWEIYQGTLIDLTNLKTIYRIKKFYNIDNNIIYQNIIPVSYKLSKDNIHNLVGSNDVDLYLANLQSTFYGKHLQKNNDNFDLQCDTLLDKITYLEAKKDNTSLSILNSYLLRKEAEIKRLIMILTAVNYRLNPKLILEKIERFNS